MVSDYAARVSAVQDIQNNGVDKASKESLEWAVREGRRTGTAEKDLAAAQKRIEELNELEREASRGRRPASAPLEVTVRGGKRTNTSSLFGGSKGGGGGSSGKSEDEQAQDRLDRYIESLVRQRAVMEAEIATVGKSNAERKAAIEIAKAQVDLEKLGTAAKAEYIAKLTEEVGKNEEVRASKERLQQAQQGLNDAQKYFGNAAVDALEDLIINGEKAEDVVKRLAASLAKAALQALLIGEGPLAGLFGMKGVGGGAGGLLGGINLFGRATGGPVNAGQPYRVGERGPETFVPTTPGKIIPAGRSGGLTVNPTYQIDARGSQMSEAQFRAILSENNAALKAEMPGYLGKLQQRGGT
jgi:hypothetical protein